MSRIKRSINRRYKVFCEGDTEYNYFEHIRKNKLISLTLTPVNMNGGGYSNFLEEVKKDSNTDCLAKFIIVDGDRAFAEILEKKTLRELAKYCITQNESKRTPHILIIDYPNFEYVACLHCKDYNGGPIDSFIKKALKYKSVDAFKADENVYTKLNSEKRTYKNIKENVVRTNCIIENEIKIQKAIYNIMVKTTFREDNIGKRGSNFMDFFEVTDGL